MQSPSKLQLKYTSEGVNLSRKEFLHQSLNHQQERTTNNHRHIKHLLAKYILI